MRAGTRIVTQHTCWWPKGKSSYRIYRTLWDCHLFIYFLRKGHFIFGTQCISMTRLRIRHLPKHSACICLTWTRIRCQDHVVQTHSHSCTSNFTRIKPFFHPCEHVHCGVAKAYLATHVGALHNKVNIVPYTSVTGCTIYTIVLNTSQEAIMRNDWCRAGGFWRKRLGENII